MDYWKDEEEKEYWNIILENASKDQKKRKESGKRLKTSCTEVYEDTQDEYSNEMLVTHSVVDDTRVSKHARFNE